MCGKMPCTPETWKILSLSLFLSSYFFFLEKKNKKKNIPCMSVTVTVSSIPISVSDSLPPSLLLRASCAFAYMLDARLYGGSERSSRSTVISCKGSLISQLLSQGTERKHEGVVVGFSLRSGSGMIGGVRELKRKERKGREGTGDSEEDCLGR